MQNELAASPLLSGLSQKSARRQLPPAPTPSPVMCASGANSPPYRPRPMATETRWPSGPSPLHHSTARQPPLQLRASGPAHSAVAEGQTGSNLSNDAGFR